VSRHARGNLHNAHSGSPVGVLWGRGWCPQAFGRTRLEWCVAAVMGQFVLGSCVGGPFLPYCLECVGGRLAEKCPPFF
jgi:hypothetical protein